MSERLKPIDDWGIFLIEFSFICPIAVFLSILFILISFYSSEEWIFTVIIIMIIAIVILFFVLKRIFHKKYGREVIPVILEDFKSLKSLSHKNREFVEMDMNGKLKRKKR